MKSEHYAHFSLASLMKKLAGLAHIQWPCTDIEDKGHLIYIQVTNSPHHLVKASYSRHHGEHQLNYQMPIIQ